MKWIWKWFQMSGFSGINQWGLGVGGACVTQ